MACPCGPDSIYLAPVCVVKLGYSKVKTIFSVVVPKSATRGQI